MATIVAGSYDRFLFGLQCSTSGRNEEPSLTRRFTYPAHKGPVKCIAASAPYLASGGADDLIHLYDLQSEVDLGFLMSPGDGAVSALAFHTTDVGRHPSHLLSGAADGSLSIWQAGGEWVCLKTFHGHQKEVNSIAVHQSGRLALSVSQDSTLRLWNLVKGKSAHESQLTNAAAQVAFSPSGTSYSMAQGTQVFLQEIGEPPKAVLTHPKRALCLAVPEENEILTGSEEGAIRLWDPRAPSKPAILVPSAHQTRVKAIAPERSSAVEQTRLVTSASSDGVIKMWDLRKTAEGMQGVLKPVAKAATGARLTCLVSFNPLCATSAKLKANVNLAASRAVQVQGFKMADKGTAQEQSSPKVAGLSGKAEEPQAFNGVAHDGVVDFPDKTTARGNQRKQSRRAALKVSHMSAIAKSGTRSLVQGHQSGAGKSMKLKRKQSA